MLRDGCASILPYTPKVAMSRESNMIPQLEQREMRVTIVASEYNRLFTDGLLKNCEEELAHHAPRAVVKVVRVPGAFEVPVMVNRELAQTGERRAHVVIALGVILRGSTAHADLIGEAITRELLRAACSSLVPVIHEVLLLQDEQQAQERCLGNELNRGREAARAAIAMFQVTQSNRTSLGYA